MSRIVLYPHGFDKTYPDNVTVFHVGDGGETSNNFAMHTQPYRHATKRDVAEFMNTQYLVPTDEYIVTQLGEPN